MTATQIAFPRAGWLGSLIKPRIVRAFTRRVTKPVSPSEIARFSERNTKATEAQKRALGQKYAKFEKP